jgi:hypothetical protein
MFRKKFIVCTFIFLASPCFAALHDPTKPVEGALIKDAFAKESGFFTLQSIIIGPMRRLAIINDQVVSIGSMIGGARVLAISKNHVVLFNAGLKINLYLFGRRLWVAH